MIKRKLRYSYHGKMRTIQRVGIKDDKKVLEKFLREVHYHSVSYRSHFIPSETLRYIHCKINNKIPDFHKMSSWRIYKGKYLFLFSRSLKLLTVLELPVRYQLNANDLQLKRF